MMRQRPFVTVILPVFNDADGLRRCLQALSHQTYPVSSFEVIVVDNGSTEAPTHIVEQFPFARLEHEQEPGSYAARNRGIAVANGDPLAFTDSDCVPEPQWLERGVATLVVDSSSDVVGGRVSVFCTDPTHPTSVELYELVTAFRQRRNIECLHYSVTANLFTRRHVFERIGTFNVHLRSGGDVEWGNRVHAAGYRLAYADEAVVRHPARRVMSELLRKSRRVAQGNYDRRRQRGGVVARAVRNLVAGGRAFIPKMSLAWSFARDPRLHGVSQRLKVAYVTLRVQYVSSWALVRKVFGAPSSR